ncbi:MAG: pantetheine-phosphate adenylyltransferase [Candidatus Nomurabacteria bacterium]|nr:pantetheine-phosphate adenylyltransferase [Candidatus Nomurabacteria bacterium]
MERVAITGGIGSGKSTVGDIIGQQSGSEVFNADKTAREALALPVVHKMFANYDVFTEGQIDTSKMAALIFDPNNSEQKELLESLTHPVVRTALDGFWREGQQAGQEAAFAEIPLLDKTETGTPPQYDSVITVYADDDVRLNRILQRNSDWTEQQARQRMEAQTPPIMNLAKASYVIINNGDQELLEQQVTNVLKQIKINASAARAAIYAGSFDPITNGHMEVIEQGLKAFERIVVVVATNSDKVDKYMFTIGERADIVRAATERYGAAVEVAELSGGFIAKYAEQRGIKSLIRGVRSPEDYAVEDGIAVANRLISKELDTFYIPSRGNGNEIISSSLVRKEIYGTDDWIDVMPKFAPDATTRAFSNKKLRQEWQSLIGGPDNNQENSAITNEIIQAYSNPRRRYHDSGHIVRGLHELEEFALANQDDLDDAQLDLAKFAWILHDFAHGGQEDEETSAEIADEFAYQLGYDQRSIEQIAAAILATKHDGADNSNALLSNLLADVDLAILGLNHPIFTTVMLDKYDKNMLIFQTMCLMTAANKFYKTSLIVSKFTTCPILPTNTTSRLEKIYITS